MSRYTDILHLTVAHDYYGNLEIPCDMIQEAPANANRGELLQRRRGNVFTFSADADESDVPRDLSLIIEARQHRLLRVTGGLPPHGTAVLGYPSGRDLANYRDADVVGCDARPAGHKRLCRLHVDLDGNGLRDLTLHFETVDAYWLYYVVGASPSAELMIADPDQSVSFEKRPTVNLPDGRAAQVLRSTTPIAARAQPPQSFELQEPRPGGAKTLIERLPTADVSAAQELGEVLQSNIIVYI